MKDAALSLEAWDDALARASRKMTVPSALRTADWSRVPLAIRERSFFSAAVASAHDLQYVRDAWLAGMRGEHPTRKRDDGTPMSYSRQEAIADIRQHLGVEGDTGRLTDFGSYRRQQLIQDFQTEQAYSYGRWKRDLEDPEILDEFPAQRLTRVEPRQQPRTTWMQRWAEAGSSVGWVGASPRQMAALKTSPIWAALSRFGTPYPPFDFGSGMGLEDVSREEAESMGLIPEGWDPAAAGKQAVQDFSSSVEASVKGLDADSRDWLQRQLGDLGVILGDRVELIAAAPKYITPIEADTYLIAETRITVKDGGLAVFGQRLKSKLDKSDGGTERKRFLLWAFEAVRTGKKVMIERNGQQRAVYAKLFREPDAREKGFLVVVDADDHNAFSIYPKDKNHLRKYYGITNRECPGPGKRLPARVPQVLAGAGPLRDSKN